MSELIIYCSVCGDFLEITGDVNDRHGRYIIVRPCINGCKSESMVQSEDEEKELR
jgi:hypothetical protein